MKVLTAGASGFAGRRLCPVLAAAVHHVVAMTRTRSATPGELVRATGLGKATVYRLYPTKDALVAAYLRRLAATIGAAIGEEITAHEGDPGAALLAILDAIEADLSRPGFRGCPFNNASIEFDDAQHRMDHHRQDQHHPPGPHPAHRRRRRRQHPRQPVAATRRTSAAQNDNPQSTRRTRLTPTEISAATRTEGAFRPAPDVLGVPTCTAGHSFSCSYSAGASRRERGAGEVVATTASRSRNDHMSRGLAAASHPGSGS